MTGHMSLQQPGSVWKVRRNGYHWEFCGCLASASPNLELTCRRVDTEISGLFCYPGSKRHPGPGCLLGPCLKTWSNSSQGLWWCSCPLPPARATKFPVFWVITSGHGGNQGTWCGCDCGHVVAYSATSDYGVNLAELQQGTMSGSLLQLWSVLIAMALFTFEDWADTRDLGHPLGECWCLRATLQPIWVDCTAIWSHGDIQSQDATEDHDWFCGSTTTWLCSDVHGPCCYHRPQEPPAAGPPPVATLAYEGHVAAGTMPTSVACAATYGHGVFGVELLPMPCLGCGATTVRVNINVQGSG